MAKAATESDVTGKPVLVTTEFRGVFFGYIKSRDGATVILTNARNCLYWSAQTGGFGGLAIRDARHFQKLDGGDALTHSRAVLGASP